MFGISGSELLLLLFVAVVFLGPKGFKQAIDAFRKLVAWGKSASARLREDSQLNLGDMGLSDLDLSDLDLKQYDPREIVRQAVREEMEAWGKTSQQRPQGPSSAPRPGPTEDVSRPAASVRPDEPRSN